MEKSALIKMCLFLLAVTVAFSLIIHGMDKQEIVDCLEWKEQAEQYPNFWLTPSQESQCDYHKIEIDAPIKIK